MVFTSSQSTNLTRKMIEPPSHKYHRSGIVGKTLRSFRGCHPVQRRVVEYDMMARGLSLQSRSPAALGQATTRGFETGTCAVIVNVPPSIGGSCRALKSTD